MKSKQIFVSHLAQTNTNPLMLEVDSAKGSYIFDVSGRKLLDMIAGVAVNNIGHRHPKVIHAMKEQMDKHLHVMVYGEFVQSSQNTLAEKLLTTLPSNLNAVYFLNSGTEAIEASIKLVKRHTGRKKILAFQGAYHGSTNGSLSISSNEKKKEKFRPLLPEIAFLEWNNVGELPKITEETAAVFLETVQGDAGVRIPSKQFMLDLSLRCKEVGALLVLDEIQCGMGRTGKLHAFEHFGIEPDLLVLGKGLGGGMPIGALVSSKMVMNSFSNDPALGHITTFGGHPVVCAAAAACLDVLQNEIDWQKLETLGMHIEKELSPLEGVKSIRRIGYMFAIDMDSAELVNKVVLRCMENGLIAFWFLSHPDSFRISPPLNLSEEEMQLAVEIITKSIKDCLIPTR